jgi:2-polyprenyl-3-methyl-5-hydroxy-6-metoxy-1,4-benzoquinol methylase
MESKNYYKTFKAKDAINELNLKLIELVKSYDPVSVLDFGCGTGKNLALINQDVLRIGIDISAANVRVANTRHKLPLVVCGDETLLTTLGKVDVVFTCSVLDHIEDAFPIIADLKRLARKAVIIAETNDIVGRYYFPHDYDVYGFTRIENFSFQGRFGATYHLYFLTK